MGIESAREEILKAKKKNDPELNLDNQDLTDICLNKLLNEFSSIKSFFDSITNLTLSDNKLKTIPYSLSKWKSLKNLYIHNNELSNKQFKLENFNNLEVLSISNNVDFIIPEEILCLKKLKYLFIDEDQFIMSVETFTLLDKNILIEVMHEDSEKSTTFNFDQIQNTRVLRRFFQEYQEQQVLCLQKKLDRVDKTLQIEKAVKAVLDTQAKKMTTLAEIAFLLITSIFVGLSCYFISDNWNRFEPFFAIISCVVSLGFGALFVFYKQSYFSKMDQRLLNCFERVVYSASEFDFKRYLDKTQEVEKIKISLETYLEP